MTIKTDLAIMLMVWAGMWLGSVEEVLGAPRGRRTAPARAAHRTRVDAYRIGIPVQLGQRAGRAPTHYDYPQYTGGFHARYYDELPSMFERGAMRGTAW